MIDAERLIDKLRKVLALTASPNENEASAAAATLARMLEAHNLSIADLEAKGVTAPRVQEKGHDLGKAAFRWKLNLAEGIAEFYYCWPLVDHKAKTVRFIGRPDNVEGLLMLYPWVIDQIRRLSTSARLEHRKATGEHIDPLRWQVSFGEGAASRLVERLREIGERRNVARNHVGDLTALVVHHQSENSDYLEEKYGYRVDGRETKWQRERREKDEALARAKDEFKARCAEAGDMTPYYRAHPGEHPEAIKREQRRSAEWSAEWQRREARNARRRTGSGYRRRSAVDWDKERQSDSARRSGMDNADRVNLRPFLRGETNGGERIEE